MRRLALLLALAGCAGHRYRFQHEISDSRPESASLSIVARKGVVHVFNDTNGTVSTVDSSLRIAAVAEGGTDASDVDADGYWVWHMTRIGPAHRWLGQKTWQIHRFVCHQAVGWWTQRYLVFHCSCHASTWIPKRPTEGDQPRIVDNDAEITPLTADYAHDRIWAMREHSLVTLGTDGAWTPGRIDSSEFIDQPLSLVFGARRFAFLSGGVVYSGVTDGAVLRVTDRLEPPEPIRRITFNSRDEDLLCLWTQDAVWAWDLESGESVRFKCSWPLAWVDFRARRILGIQGDTLFSAREDGSDLRTARLPK